LATEAIQAISTANVPATADLPTNGYRGSVAAAALTSGPVVAPLPPPPPCGRSSSVCTSLSSLLSALIDSSRLRCGSTLSKLIAC
jgi:hypothetical protein